MYVGFNELGLKYLDTLRYEVDFELKKLVEDKT